MFFELLALAWLLSGFATTGILSYQHSEAGTKMRVKEILNTLTLGTFGLGGVLSGMWLERQKCLEQIATSLKKAKE
jgi:hypothetical protein